MHPPNHKLHTLISRLLPSWSDACGIMIHELEHKRTGMMAKLNGIRHYIDMIRDGDQITRFDETLWLSPVARLLIKPDGTMRFEFKGGPAIEG